MKLGACLLLSLLGPFSFLANAQTRPVVFRLNIVPNASYYWGYVVEYWNPTSSSWARARSSEVYSSSYAPLMVVTNSFDWVADRQYRVRLTAGVNQSAANNPTRVTQDLGVLSVCEKLVIEAWTWNTNLEGEALQVYVFGIEYPTRTWNVPVRNDKLHNQYVQLVLVDAQGNTLVTDQKFLLAPNTSTTLTLQTYDDVVRVSPLYSVPDGFGGYEQVGFTTGITSYTPGTTTNPYFEYQPVMGTISGGTTISQTSPFTGPRTSAGEGQAPDTQGLINTVSAHGVLMEKAIEGSTAGIETAISRSSSEIKEKLTKISDDFAAFSQAELQASADIKGAVERSSFTNTVASTNILRSVDGLSAILGTNFAALGTNIAGLGVSMQAQADALRSLATNQLIEAASAMADREWRSNAVVGALATNLTLGAAQVLVEGLVGEAAGPVTSGLSAATGHPLPAQQPSSSVWMVALPNGYVVNFSPFEVSGLVTLASAIRATCVFVVLLAAVAATLERVNAGVAIITATASQGAASSVPGFSRASAFLASFVALSALSAFVAVGAQVISSLAGLSPWAFLGGNLFASAPSSTWAYALFVADQFFPIGLIATLCTGSLLAWWGMDVLALKTAMLWRVLTGCLFFALIPSPEAAGWVTVEVRNLRTNSVIVSDLALSRHLPPGWVGQVVVDGDGATAWGGVELPAHALASGQVTIDIADGGLALHDRGDIEETVWVVLGVLTGMGSTIWCVRLVFRVLRVAQEV
jgi:hypothetical protein